MASNMSTQAQAEVNLYSRPWPVQTNDASKVSEYVQLIRKANYPHGVNTKEGAKAFCALITRSKHHFRIAAMELAYLHDSAATWATATQNRGQFGQDDHKMAFFYDETRRWRPLPPRTIERTSDLDVLAESIGIRIAGLVQPRHDTTGVAGLSDTQQVLVHLIGIAMAELFYPDKVSARKLTQNSSLMRMVADLASVRVNMPPVASSVVPGVSTQQGTTSPSQHRLSTGSQGMPATARPNIHRLSTGSQGTAAGQQLPQQSASIRPDIHRLSTGSQGVPTGQQSPRQSAIIRSGIHRLSTGSQDAPSGQASRQPVLALRGRGQQTLAFQPVTAPALPGRTLNPQGPPPPQPDTNKRKPAGQ